uniref:Chloroplast envelope membrane protein n=1 Tax=Eria corneri TaxID=1211290 RepID=A0A650AZK9_9ASPA|nr:chloroplast envelope membrane protein [Eria corneri]
MQNEKKESIGFPPISCVYTLFALVGFSLIS